MNENPGAGIDVLPFSLTELFAAVARRRPEAVALAYEDGRAGGRNLHLSYGELDRRSGLLAGRLCRDGVDAETPVGIFAERSVEMVVGMLGILKAGGAYVPLDPEYPAERIAFMLADTAVRVVIARRELRERGSLATRASEVKWIDPRDLPANGSVPSVDPSGGDRLAYVIYTSGSTGRPKGIRIPHRAVVNLVWRTDYVDLRASDRIAQASNAGFDAATFEIWGALIHGARLVGLPREVILSPRNLARELRAKHISTLFLTTALFNQVAREAPRAFAGLRYLLFGGEAVDPGPVRRILERGSPAELLHVYGPTESTTFATWEKVCRVAPGASTVPIGRAVARTRLAVLTDRLHGVPAGRVAELFLGGTGLARGYGARPGMTAERFVPDPGPGRPGERLYRTGDLVRLRDDGRVEYVGRVDDQVKIRGFRIEPGEIESALLEHRGVRQAVVVAQEEGAGSEAIPRGATARGETPRDLRLVAYVVPVEQAVRREHLVPSLRFDLLGRLPEYMVPVSFVVLEELPLNPNGKVDRGALPRPQPRPETLSPQVAPRTAVEEVLGTIWKEVLALPKIGVYDDFFALGGHSLLATRILSRVRSIFSVDLPISALFEAPSVVSLSAQVEAALEQGRKTAWPPLVAAPRKPGGGAPLSFAQERLWFFDQYLPGNALYNIPLAFALRGPLVFEALAGALREIVRRHEILRTVFAEADGRPVQILSEWSPILPRIDLRGLPVERRTVEGRRLIRHEAARPFDLKTGPLLRSFVVRLRDREQFFFVSQHHIISDGWSVDIFHRELQELYGALCRGEPSPLEELTVQYADFAVWQRDVLRGEIFYEHLRFWREQLRGIKPVLELPTDRPRPALRGYEGSARDIALGSALAERLRALSRRRGTTLNMTLLAGFHTLLFRLTGQRKILVGIPVAGRGLTDVEDLLGFFVNMLVMAADFATAVNFQDLLGRLRKMALKAYTHADLPFEKLVEELGVERDISTHPLFQVAFALQGARMAPSELSGLEVSAEALEQRSARFDLELHLWESGPKLTGFLAFAADLFDPTTAARMIGHYENLLRAAVQTPAAPLAQLPLLDLGEFHQLLVGWNDTADPQGNGRSADAVLGAASVQELFRHRAKRQSDAVAVVAGERWLSYGALGRWAARLARDLLCRGVGPGEVVPVLSDRALEMAPAYLAVLEAGGAYLPLDPAVPRARLEWMARESRARVLLARSGLEELATALARTSPGDRTEVMTLAVAAPAVPRGGARVANDDSGERRAPLTSASGEHPAYVLYTSGSTGRPKGVVIPHRGLLNLVRWYLASFGVTPNDRVAVTSAVGFDATVLELWSGLAAGMAVHLAHEEELSTPEAIWEWLRTERVTQAFLATPLAEAVLEEPHPEARRRDLRLRAMRTGGGALGTVSRELPFAFYNLYGPAENSAVVSFSRVTTGEATTIGRPLPGVEAFVVDASLVLLPEGVPGELAVRGEGLARGYLRRPRPTVQAFVPSPFGTSPGERLYRTGDLVRYRKDGRLDFLGRVDHQVEVRGFRVELEEIEAVLREHRDVKDAVGMLRRGATGSHLVAFVEHRPKESPSLERELRDHAARFLPSYMIPAAFVLLERFPKTATRKVDRRALAEHPMLEDEILTLAHRPYLAPRTATEQSVAEIWQEALGVEKVGVEDDFFELGGHSLLAIRILSRLRKVFRAELPLNVFFQAPTVAGSARSLEALLARGRRSTTPPILSRKLSAGPLSFAQERLWFLDRLVPDHGFYNIATAFRSTGPLDAEALAAALRELVRRHESLRTVFREEGGSCEGKSGRETSGRYPPGGAALQIVLPVGERVLARIDLEALRPSRRLVEVRERVVREAVRPFDLEAGPVARFFLFRLAAEDHVLLFAFHHIVADGWSMAVFFQELETLYEQLQETRPREGGSWVSPLPELALSYLDYAVWQRSWLTDERLAEALDFFKRLLGEDPPALELPLDRPRPAVQSYRGTALPFRLPRGLVEGLGALSRQEGATTAMTLLAAFNVLLGRLTSERRILVGMPAAGRGAGELEGIVGFFVNNLVHLGDLAGDPPFRELLARVRKAALQAYTYQDLPFEKLVEELRPERDLSKSPLIQVLFAVQSLFVEPPSLSGVTLRPFETGFKSSRVDLEIHLQESREGLSGFWSFATDLFDVTTVARISAHYANLLAAALRRPETSLSDLTFWSQGERHQVMVEWNDTAEEAEPSLLARFWEQAERRPAAVAVVERRAGAASGDAMSYGELARNAARMARHLRRQGLGPGARVGMFLGRTREMMASLVGVLEAGAAYVPLDPSFPRERLSFMARDAGLARILTERPLLGSVPGEGVRSILVETVFAEDDPRRSPPPAMATPADPAYVLYTSGSTGKPKGVEIGRGALMNLLRAVDRCLFLTEEDVVLALTTLSFDIATAELLWPLTKGARVELVPRSVAADAEGLADNLADSRTSLMQATPITWRMLLALEEPGLDGPGAGEALLAGRRVISTGEALPADLARDLRSRARETWNLYGPTETTIWSTAWRVAPSGRGVLVGRPITSTSIYVLGAGVSPVPVGVFGELSIGGAGLARGYLSRPRQTAERFVPNPFAPGPLRTSFFAPPEPGERLFRTGDLARYLPDGSLEVAGRLDDQVKVRGYRIELREIEAVLAGHPAVRSCGVLARAEAFAGSSAPPTRLVAFVVLRGAEGSWNVSHQLRRHLRSQLPEYMIPARFVELSKLPLLPNGKLDRAALAGILAQDVAAAAGPSFVAPRTATEQSVAQIWQDALGVDAVGVEDNFFDLGGHSLLALRIRSRMRTVFGVELPLSLFFQTPTVAESTRYVEERRELARSPETPPISPLWRSAGPLSFGQERLWFLDRLVPGRGAYNMAFAYRASGPLDLAALEGALLELVRRHESLRTLFSPEPVARREPTPAQKTPERARDGSPEEAWQVVRGVPQKVLAQVDLALLGTERGRTRLDEARKQADAEASRSFDLASGSLLRASLFRLDAEDHILLFVLHHIVFDGWSIAVFCQELEILYAHLRAARKDSGPQEADRNSGRALTSPLPVLPVSYLDFAFWQRAWLTEEVLAPALEFFRRELGENPPDLNLPFDRPRPATPSYGGATLACRLPRGLAGALRSLSREGGATTTMTLLAGFAILLGRLSGQSKVLVSMPAAGRGAEEIEGVIGFFVNNLVLAANLAGDPSMKELLSRVRGAALGAYTYQDLPFEKLVEELRPERDIAKNPLAQVAFTMQNLAFEPPALLGAELCAFEIRLERSRFDLELHLQERQEELVGFFSFATDLFDTTTVARLAGYFENLLMAAADRPQRPLSRLSLLGPEETHQVLAEWSDTADLDERPALFPPTSGAVSPQALFRARAARQGDAVAVVAGGRWLSYRALGRWTSRLVAALVRRGVGREDVVAVLSDRALEMVPAYLAALEVGGAYLPLDPAVPKARLEWMTRESRTPALLVKPGLDELAAALVRAWPGGAVAALPIAGPRVSGMPVSGMPVSGMPVSGMPVSGMPGGGTTDGGTTDDETTDGGTTASATPRPAAVSGEHPAYVLYTSGSTGKPKGVMVTHRGLLNLIRWYLAAFRVTGGDRVALTSAVGFDATVLELWPGLAVGASLHLPEEADLSTPEAIWGWMLRRRITQAFLATPLAEAVLEEPPTGERSGALGLRALRTGGAALRAVSQELPFAFYNLYGPAENSAVVSFSRVTSAQEPTIGRPIPGVRARVLDTTLAVLPEGVPGELVVRGVGLARGYLRRPRPTAAAFVPDPHGGRPGGRLYRTGDLARFLGDGRLDFLGRLDHQVEIRGFRVELEEVEAVLREHRDVSDAVVVLRRGTAGSRLVAFVEPRAGMPESLRRALRAHAEEFLPSYMVPAAFVLLERFPKTATRKVDRKALAAHPTLASEGRTDFSETAYIAPRTATEQSVAQIWREALEVDRVGVEDDFFELGGHSLLAIRILSRMRKVFQVELSLAEFFKPPTVAGSARRLEASLAGAGRAKTPPIAPRGLRSGPLSFAQERLWFLDRLMPEHGFYNIAAAFRAAGPLDAGALEAALRELVRRHESLRTVFGERDVLREKEEEDLGGVAVQIVKPVPRQVLGQVDLGALPGGRRLDEARRKVSAEAARPFDLASGPVFRAALVRLGAEDTVLLFVFHHIITDGWSMAVFFRELEALYGSARAGGLGGSPLPPLPVTYLDYAVWQKSWLTDERLGAALDFFQRELGENPPALHLPFDRPRPAVQSYRGAALSFRFPEECLGRLRALSRREGATSAMTLLAAFNALLGRLTSERRILVGMPSAGRGAGELEGIVGFFVNNLVILGDLVGRAQFREILARVRRSALTTYTHQDLPFERLVEELRPERDLSKTPLIQVLFAVQNLFTETPSLPGAVLRPFETGLESSRFDLELHLRESRDELSGFWSFATDLFDRTTVARMIGAYEHLLTAALQNPETPLEELPLTSRGERHQVLVEWNDTSSDPGPGLLERFREQAARRAEAIAVVERREGPGSGAAISYGELARGAARIARYFRRQGVERRARVGIFLDRTCEMVASLFGVLAVGAAYVPLDPSYPRERLSFMVRDAGLALILTESDLLGAVPGHGVRTVAVSEVLGERDLRDPGPADDRATAVASPADPAYVLYTSGSTGKPKGVSIDRGALSNLLHAIDSSVGLTPEDVVLALTTLSFDIATAELFWPLLKGARVELVPRSVAADAEALAGCLANSRTTLMQATPVTWRMLLAVDGPAAAGPDPGAPLLAGRRVISTGEALLRDLAGELRSRARETWNLYGPTETTIWSTAWRASGGRRKVLVGRPLTNTVAYLLGAGMAPVPLGAFGELFLGGAGLARGYLARPGQTAERFVPDPFAGGSVASCPASLRSPGARLFRTGDLARFLPDGHLEVAGRLDHQVKVRGHRIELQEIETVLARHPAVRSCGVAARAEAGEGGSAPPTRLVAYVVLRGAVRPRDLPRELREHLRSRLPEFMIPARFLELSELPRLPNGKLDRAALGRAAQSALGSGTGEDFVAPRTATERAVAAIWQEALGVEKVGTGDSFFDLGGHSLLALRILSRLRQRFGVELPLSVFFRAPTVAASARFVEESLEEGKTSTARPIVPLGRARDPLSTERPERWISRATDPISSVRVEIDPAGSGAAIYLVPPATGDLRCYRGLIPHLPPERPLYGLRPPAGPPGETLRSMARMCRKALGNGGESGSFSLLGRSDASLLALEIARQEPPEALVLIDPISPELPRKWGDEKASGLFAEYVAGLAGTRFEIPAGISNLEPEEQWDYLLLKLRATRALPSGVAEEELKRRLSSARRRVRMLREYVPLAYHHPVDLLLPEEREDVLEAWRPLLRGPLRIHLVAAGACASPSPCNALLGRILKRIFTS